MSRITFETSWCNDCKYNPKTDDNCFFCVNNPILEDNFEPVEEDNDRIES